MIWKNSSAFHELPPSGDELASYLLRGVKELMGVDATFDPQYLGCYGRLLQGEKLIAFFLQYHPELDDESDIASVKIENGKEQGLGKLLTKAFLGQAFGKDRHIIRANRVTEDGLYFWARLGFVPLMPPKNLAPGIRDQLSRFPGSLSLERQLDETAQVAETHPYHGFRKLAQLKPIANNAKDAVILHVIRSRISYEKDLILLPAEPTTQRILRDKLGILPPFRPLTPDSPYSHIMQALQAGSKTGFELSL